MATPTDRLIEACRRWAEEVDEPAYALVYWAQLFLGGAYEGVGKNPDLSSMTPSERETRPMSEHEGHPTLDQLRARINVLLKKGMFEAFLISALAIGIAGELDELADAPAAFAKRRKLVADLDRLASDPDQRAQFVSEVRRQREASGYETSGQDDDGVDGFVRRAKENLQPLTSEEIAKREWSARQWRAFAGDLLDIRSEISKGLSVTRGPTGDLLT